MPDYDRYAVFGHPIAHSQSPTIHRLFAEHSGHTRVRYEACDVSADRFSACARDFFAQGGKGLNCTLPLKEPAFAITAQNSPRAQQAKAVNTLIMRQDGSLFGDNTDGIGLVRDLEQNLSVELKGLDILVLGAGGATRGILGPILERGPSSLFVANRTAAKARELVLAFSKFGTLSAGGLDELSGRRFDLILNATAASLSQELPPLPDSILNRQGVCYDLAYAKQPTAFVKWGHAQDASISVDGIGMLVEQAAEAFFLWRGVFPETARVIQALRNERFA